MQALHLVFQTLFLILAPAWRGAWNMEKSLMHNLEEIPSSLSSCQAESAGFSPLTHQGQQKGSLDHPHDESADSGSDCELGERCVGQSDENLSSWYVWFLVLCSLAVLLSCGMCCCLQCWLKRRSCLPRSTVAVFALSSSDAFGATEAPPCPFSGSLSPCRTAEISSSPAPCFSLGGTELPPSYEDVMKENKL